MDWKRKKSSSNHPSSPPVKAKQITGYNDTKLYQTIQECQNVKQKLRKVPDPELVKRKQRQSKYNQGYLGMSSDSLQKARQDLKQVQNDNNDDTNQQQRYRHQVARWPLTTLKDNNKIL